MRYLLLALVVLPMAAIAETVDRVEMKNGDVYRGEVIEQKFGEYIQIRFKDGNEKRLVASDISSLKREDDKKTDRIIATVESSESHFTEITGGASGSIAFADPVLTDSLTGGLLFGTGPIQFGPSIFLEHTYNGQAGTSSVLFGMALAPRFNFSLDSKRENAFFFEPGIGVGFLDLRDNVSKGVQYTRLLFGFGIGKRFAITQSVSYSPAFSVTKILDLPTIIGFNLVNFSFSF